MALVFYPINYLFIFNDENEKVAHLINQIGIITTVKIHMK
ncbi:MAG: hypothetical protein ACJA2G_001670, partial [Cognaticolwellia sp.]